MRRENNEFNGSFSRSGPLVDRLLDEAHRRILTEHIPLIVALFIMAGVGIIGNTSTISYYSVKVKRTTTFVLIKLLAIVDIIVCLLIFTTIADLCVNIKYKSAVLCKLMYFVDHWLMQSSLLILWIIAIHRYRTICIPLRRQLTEKSATVAVIIVIVFSMVYCTHIFVTYSPVTVNISTSDVAVASVIGHYCTNTDDIYFKDILIAFHLTDVVLVTFCFITFLFTYGNIWRTVRKHSRRAMTTKMDPFSQQGQQTSSRKVEMKVSSSNCREDLSTDQFTYLPENTTETSLKTQTEYEQSSISIIEPVTFPHKKNRTYEKPSPQLTPNSRERNITLMMFAITIGLVICFVPYFICSVGIRAASVTKEDELNTGIQLALRFPFFNSVINPVIICYFDSHYRTYVSAKFIRCVNRK